MRKRTTMSTTTTQNDVLIIHVWPEPSSDVGGSLWPDSKPISDEREEDVWDRLRNLTTNPNVRRDIVVMTCSNNPEADRSEVLREFLRDRCAPGRIKTIEPLRRTHNIWAPLQNDENVSVVLEGYNYKDKDGTWETTTTPIVKSVMTHPNPSKEEIIPRTFASSVDAKAIVDIYKKGRMGALLIWHPRTAEDHGFDGDDLRHLSYLKEQGV